MYAFPIVTQTKNPKKQTSFLALDEVLSDWNAPLPSETLLIICGGGIFRWRGRAYPEWATQKNVVWLVEGPQQNGG